MHVTSKSGRVLRIPTAEEDSRICAGIASDPDTCELSDNEMEALRPRPPGRPKSAQTKEAVSIRLSPAVLDAFRAGGPGWQTRIDNVLVEWVRSHPAA